MLVTWRRAMHAAYGNRWDGTDEESDNTEGV